MSNIMENNLPIQVQPALLERDLYELQRKIDLVKSLVQEVHLDIMDGEFVPNTTINDPNVVTELQWGDLQVSLHLMIANPLLHLRKWALPLVSTIYIHYESAVNASECINVIRSLGKKVGLAINPHTPTLEIKDYIPQVDAIMIMGVEPGFSGQGFNNDVLSKIRYVRELAPQMNIAVDGGVNAATKDNILKAGANILCANSYLFSSQDLPQVIQNLKNVTHDA